MNTTMGCPTKQNDIQNETLPSSLLAMFRIFEVFFWMMITGACIIMPKKAHQVMSLRGTETTYSWATAEMKNTIMLAALLE